MITQHSLCNIYINTSLAAPGALAHRLQRQKTPKKKEADKSQGKDAMNNEKKEKK